MQRPGHGPGGNTGSPYGQEFAIPAGSEQMMQFASATISQNVNSRLASAIPVFGQYWENLKHYFEVDNGYEDV